MTQQSTLPGITSSGPQLEVRADASWLPEAMRERIREQGRVEHSTGMTRAEKKVMRKRRRIPVSQWAERHRVLTQSSMPGPWRNRTTPYLAGLMDAALHPSVQEIGLCKAPQVGGTEAAHNFVGYAIDRDPGPVLYVFPDEIMAKENNRDRVLPMIKSSPRLHSYMTQAVDDASNLRINLQHMQIHMAWARSASRLGNKPIRYLIFDETDKYPEQTSKRESGPIQLGSHRTQTYKQSRKIWKLSTPTTERAPIWHYMSAEAEAVFHFEVACPRCGHRQIMELGREDSPHGIKWPEEERDPARIENNDLAWYKCAGPLCQADPNAAWSDYERDRAVRSGQWREANSGLELFEHLRKHRPRRIGFHLPAWISPFVPLSEVAAAFLRSYQDKTELKNFLNNYAAEPWLDYEVEREEDQILELCDERPRGQVPGGGQTACLVAGVDTQDDGFWFEIRAVGYGVAQDSWQIREGFIPADWTKVSPDQLQGRSWPYHPAFDTLRKVLFEDTYQDPDGTEYHVLRAAIDAMGHHTSEVYDFCRAHRGRIVPVQGMRSRANRPTKWSRIDTYPGTNKAMPGGVQLLQVDTNHYKDQLATRLQIAPLDPGAWRFHSQTSRDWARHLCAEYLDEQSNRWVCPGHKANHGWDCSVYILALVDELGVKYWDFQPSSGNEEPGEARREKKTKQPRRGRW